MENHGHHRRRMSFSNFILYSQDAVSGLFSNKRASRGNFLNNENDGSSSVEILKTSECKKDVRSVSPSVDETVAVNNNNDSEKYKQTDIKIPSKRHSDSVLKSSLVTSLSPTSSPLCKDEVDGLLEIVGGKLNKSISKDSGLDQSPENVTFDTSLSSNCEPLCHNIALDESAFTVGSSLGDTSVEGKSITSCQLSPLSSMSPETEFNDLSMSECQEEKTFENGEIMNPRSPFSLNLEGRGNFPLVQMVCRELLVTERSYVNDLKEVIEGYINHMKKNSKNEDIDIFDIFGNLEDIYEFNKEVLTEIELCEVNESEIDPIKLATVFCEKTSGFNKHYTQYCTEYPEAASALTYLMKDPGVANFFLERQSSIGHALSLESYLLKPVQRILKYNLLLKDILKKYCGDEDGYKIINTALYAMSDVAEYINEMKRLHENARQVDDILSNIVDIDESVNRYTTGKFVLENTFKVHGVRGDRTIILFEKLLIMVKKTEDKQLQYKDIMECSNMMIVESMPKEPLGFQLLRFDNQKDTYTIVAKTPEIKKEWTQHLKRLILENFAEKIPQTARQAILGEEQAKSKYNSLPMQALDNTGMNTLRKPMPKGCKSPNIRDSANLTTGMKRESKAEETLKEPKRTLRPKDEKKSRSNVTSPETTRSEKEKKEKVRWFPRHKHKPSLDSVLNMEATTEEEINNDFVAKDGTMIKSRSLESLQNALKLHGDVEFKPGEETDDVAGSPDLQEPSPSPSPSKKKSSTIRNRSKSAINNPLSFGKDDVFEENTEKCSRPEEDTPSPECYSPEIPDEKIAASPEIPDTEASSEEIIDSNVSKEGGIFVSNDERNSYSQIKQIVNKVSHALQNSFHMYSGGSAGNTNVPSNDMSQMFFSPSHSSPTLKNNSEATATTDVSTDSPMDRYSADLSLLNENIPLNGNTSSNPMNSESESDTITGVDELLPPKPDKTELGESDDNTWLTNVDALFYKVNADLDSIAGSIASDTAKSNDSGSDVNNTPTDSSTSIGIETIEKVNEADETTDEISELITPTENVVQVNQVANRIKEYKRLVDAEKRRHSWTQREPKDIHEMLESLDSIQTVDNALSPTYSSLRRRFRPSRDYGAGRENRSSWEIYNETPRAQSPSRMRSLDSCLQDTPFVEIDEKPRSMSSLGHTLEVKMLETHPQTTQRSDSDNSLSSSQLRNSSSSYEYVEAALKSPDPVSAANLATSLPACLDGHILAKHSSLENVFYTKADDVLSKSEKSMSLPAAINRKESKDRIERKISDTTNVSDTISMKNQPMDLAAYNNLLKEGESVAKRTEVYFRALKNFEQHKRKPVFQKPKTPSFTTCDFSPFIAYNHELTSRSHIHPPSSVASAEEIDKHRETHEESKMEGGELLESSLVKNIPNLKECREESIEISNASCTDDFENALPTNVVTEKLDECQQNDSGKHNEYCPNERHSEQLHQKTLTAPSDEDKYYDEKTKKCPLRNDENNNEKHECVETVSNTNNDETANTLCIGRDENNNEKNKVFHIGNEKTKVFRIGGEGNLNNEKKNFRIEKQKIKPYQFNNSEKRQPNENIEKIKLCRISGNDKTLKCRLDIVEKTNVSRQEEKTTCHDDNKSDGGDKIRIFQQDSDGIIELKCDNKTTDPKPSVESQPAHDIKTTTTLNIRDSRDEMNDRRSKSVSLAQPSDKKLPRPQSTFTTETFINLDKRSLKKSNSSPPPETCNFTIPPSNEKENLDKTRKKDNGLKIESRLNKTLTSRKAPDIFSCTLPLTPKRMNRSCSMPSVNGISYYTGDCKEKSTEKREQIDQLKSKLDSCAVDESPRGRTMSTKNCSEENPSYHRSTSLPRRKTNFLLIPNQDLEETTKYEKNVLRSPSIRNIQQNHVNNRIKDYFVNLQKSSEISRSRPNLLLVDTNSSDSDSEGSIEENDNLTLTENDSSTEDKVQIYRGTVRTMIQKYGQTNFVFD